MRNILIGCFLLLNVFSVHKADAQLTDFMWHRGFMFGQTTLPAFNLPADTFNLMGRSAFQFGLNWGGRVNVHNIDDDHSLSLHVDVIYSVFLERGWLQSPARVLGIGGGFQIPIVVNYNIGHMASKNALADRGFAFGLGVEINRMRYVPGNIDLTKIEINSGTWLQPVLNFGYRYWKDDLKAREFNMQFGWGYVDRLSTSTNFRPNVRLSLHKYINY